MEWAIDHIITNYVGNRDIVVLGQGHNALKWSPFIEKTKAVSRSINALPGEFDAASEYLIICEDMKSDRDAQLSAMGMEEIRDYYNWTKCASTNGHLPIDAVFNGIRIGYGSYVPYSRSNMRHYVEIGRFCSIHESVIVQGNHSLNRITTNSLYPLLNAEARRIVEQTPSDKDRRGTNRKVKIGNDVWIAAGAFINASRCSEIGNGAVIGAGSVVMDDVPPYAIVYGSPARIRRYRFTQEEIRILERVKWWEWDRQKLNENIGLLMNPDLFFEKYSEQQLR